MGPGPVVVVDVLGEDGFQVLSPEHEQMVEAVLADGANSSPGASPPPQRAAPAPAWTRRCSWTPSMPPPRSATTTTSSTGFYAMKAARLAYNWVITTHPGPPAQGSSSDTTGPARERKVGQTPNGAHAV